VWSVSDAVSSALLAKGVEQHRLLSFTNRVDVELFGARADPKVRCQRLPIPPGREKRDFWLDELQTKRLYLETLYIAGDATDCTEYRARHVANFNPTPTAACESAGAIPGGQVPYSPRGAEGGAEERRHCHPGTGAPGPGLLARHAGTWQGGVAVEGR
jgi:hypothetical protein